MEFKPEDFKKLEEIEIPIGEYNYSMEGSEVASDAADLANAKLEEWLNREKLSRQVAIDSCRDELEKVEVRAQIGLINYLLGKDF